MPLDVPMPPELPQRQLRRHRIGAALISIGLLGSILWRLQPGRLTEVFSHLRPLPLVGALGCVVAAGALMALRWGWMLQAQGIRDGFMAAWRGTLVGNALSAALLGALLGDVAKSGWYARRERHSYGRVLLACGLDRACGGVGLVLYGGLSLTAALAWGGGLNLGLPEGAPWRTGALTILMLIVITGLLLRSTRRRLEARLQTGMAQWRETRRALGTRPSILVGAIGVSIIANLLVGGTLACALAAAAPGPLPWASLLWTFPVIGLAASMPLTLAGAGTRESAAIAIWAAFQISAPVAVMASLVTLAATLAGALPGGFLFWFHPDAGSGRRT
ncbi:MAG: lysylphosphatidylglycerol synthase transmembrane domain-containing protein [Verrucomicrobiota bacterium]